MQPLLHNHRSAFLLGLTRRGVLAALLILAFSAGAAAQSPPPIQGKIAPDESTDQLYKGGNVIVAGIVAGVQHAYNFTKNLVVRGGGPDQLTGLSEGKTIVVHYPAGAADLSAPERDLRGAQDIRISEGVVTHINHRKNEMTIRFDSGSTETLQATSAAMAETAAELQDPRAESRIVVYYTDETGRKVANYAERAK